MRTVAGWTRVNVNCLRCRSAVESTQFTVFLNGVAILGATYGSGAGTQQNSGQVIIAIIAGDVIEITLPQRQVDSRRWPEARKQTRTLPSSLRK
ncbi:MAG: triple helix repeat-containing collagen [Bryobacterales bacterium]|nr:triple helix repeat-containing collagen [Bryobacterales bacterium]